jgi:hypothetical protein
MGLPSGTFTHPASGRLQVVFRGAWTADDAEWTGGDWDILLRCYVGSGGARRTAMVSLRNSTATIEVPYTGGAEVHVGMEYVTHGFGTAATVTAKDLTIACHLLPPVQRPRVLRFADLLQQLTEQLRPMALTPQTPRWEPDTDTGVHWFVRPLSAMATHSAAADRFTSEDPAAPGTTFFNHPLAADRDVNPIDPASVSTVGYASKTWTGTPVPMDTQVLTDTTTSPGTVLYYIRSSNGPGFTDPLDGVFKGTAIVEWNYADLSELEGASYETAWPGLSAVDKSVMSPGDTLWVCGEFDDQVLNVTGLSGIAGAYVKIRLDYPSDPGRINAARVLTGTWTPSGSEWWLPMPNTSECMLFQDDERLVGINTRSRCRARITAYDATADTINIGNIRRILTGHPIDIASDFVTDGLPAGLTANTRYYAIVVTSNWAFYSVSEAQYTLKLAASYADAIAGTAVDITGPPADPSRNAFVYVQQHDYPFYDPVIGALEPGQYAVDVVQQRLYMRPTSGAPGDYTLRLASESYAAIGACIYGENCSYIKILGGGEYGGLFADTPAPLGRVGMAHQNAIEFNGSGSDIVVDGLLIKGCRSGVAFLNVQRGTVRNSRVRDCAHHACGGESLTGTQEPDLLLERNWISEIGNKHEFGDAQALVTNPHCDRAIYRRNLVQHLGDNKKVSNPSGAVFDASAYVSAYLNWFDDCHGKTFELEAGNGEPPVLNPVVFASIVTRQGQGLPRSENLVQRVGLVHLSLNGPTDSGVIGARVIGNLVAWASIGNRAPDTLDDCGLVYQRTNNHSTGGGSNELAAFERNAVFSVDGPVWAIQKNANASAAPWPTRAADRNLYAGVPEFGIQTSSGTVLQTWSGAQIQGLAAGNWTADTGNDVHSELAVLSPQDLARGPTLAELEILRLYDEYDTYEQPTEDLMGAFPFADVAE